MNIWLQKIRKPIFSKPKSSNKERVNMKKIVSAIKIISLILVVSCAMMCMTACGKVVNIKINDMGVITEAEANTGMTIQKILDESCIKLS